MAFRLPSMPLEPLSVRTFFQSRRKGRNVVVSSAAADKRRYASARPRDFCRRSHRDDLPASVAALGAEIDDVVGAFDDFEIVLDDDDGMALVDQFVKRPEQALDVVKVQAGGGLVENKQRSRLCAPWPCARRISNAATRRRRASSAAAPGGHIPSRRRAAARARRLISLVSLKNSNASATVRSRTWRIFLPR